MTMGRRLRRVGDEGTLVSITWRTVQGRFLFRPGELLNDVVLGVLGRTQRLRPIGVCGVTVLSNHIHLLLVADDAKQVADFMQYLGSNLAREVNRLTDWAGPVFQHRYSMITVTDEEAAQIERLKYLLAQGCKEHLVERVRDWPGVHSVGALVDGTPLVGHWVDRSREYIARRCRKGPDEQSFRTEETVALSPVPCWRHLSAEGYRDRVARLVDEIEEEAAAERRLAGRTAMGRRAVLAQHPHHRPELVARLPAPLVHAASRAARIAFHDAYAWFTAAFRKAAERIRQGDRSACFPPGSFPPGLPFVPNRP